MDVATSMRKLDIEDVTLLYHKQREHMPVFENRYDLCRENGIKFIYCTMLKEIHTGAQNAIKEVICQKTELKEEDDGKVNAVPIEGSEFALPADTVIFSIGQELDHTLIDLFELEISEEGRVKIDPETSQTNDPFVFAAGSCVERTDTVIEAVAKGQQAARRIVKYLLG